MDDTVNWTMDEHVDAWLTSLARRSPKPASPRTIENYKHKVVGFLEWLGDRSPTADVLFAYRMERQRAGRQPATIRVDFAAIYDFFAYLRRAGYPGAAAFPRSGDVDLPSRAVGSSRPRMSDRDVQALFQAAERMPTNTIRKRYLKQRALAILALLGGAGLRRAELLGLRVADIRQDMDPWHVQVREGKGAQPRMVPLGDDGRAYVDEWLALRRLWCDQHQHHSDALFPVDSVRRLSDRGLDSIWDELISSADLAGRGFTPHCFRHWYGTKVHGVADLATAQKLLGHKRVETTFQYLGTDQVKMESAARQVTFRNRTPEVEQGSGSYAPSRQPDPRPRRPLRRIERR